MIASKSYPLVALIVALAGCSSTSNQSASASDGGGKAKVKMNGTCPTNTGFVGDDMCMAPPAESEGFQLHYGPSDYDNPEEVAKFTLAPSEETNDCYFVKTSNTTDQNYSGFNFQMRPGSHHLIGQSRTAPVPDGFGACEATDGAPTGLFAQTQTPKADMRVDPAAENQGFARAVPAHTQAVLNFHVINATQEPTLREAWMNYYYIQPDQITAQRGAIDLNGGLGFYIKPGTHQTYPYSCSPTQPVRVLLLAAHMHAHATRMTIWKVSGTQKTKLLENYSWEDPATLFYDSAHTNVPADPVALKPGGDVSGDVTLQPTDSLQWECEVNNDSDKVLTFRNEVFTGEMCLVGGSVVNAVDPTKVTDFTCARN